MTSTPAIENLVSFLFYFYLLIIIAKRIIKKINLYKVEEK
jgi:hypothetical protein